MEHTKIFYKQISCKFLKPIIKKNYLYMKVNEPLFKFTSYRIIEDKGLL